MMITSKTNSGNNIMSLLLAVSFCSVLTCEEYQLADNLSKPECIRVMKEERKTIMSMEVEEAYLSYMEAFKAEHMNGEAVDWEINCVKG